MLAICSSETSSRPQIGQFGNTRHLHKQIWKLPIPEYDGTEALHGEIAAAGEAAAAGAARELARLRADRGNDVGGEDRAAGAAAVAAGVGGGGGEWRGRWGGCWGEPHPLTGQSRTDSARCGAPLAHHPAPSPPSGEGVYVVGIRIYGIRGLAGWGGLRRLTPHPGNPDAGARGGGTGATCCAPTAWLVDAPV